MSTTDHRPTHIYGLRDRRTNQLRYVGKTVMTIERRLMHHTTFARRNKGNSRCKNWIRSLLTDGLLPDCFLIETVNHGEDWADAEQFWIAYFKFVGCNLTNLTDGGEGHSGLMPTAETISKIKAHRQSEDNKSRVSEQSTKLWRVKRSEIIAAQNAGKDDAWKSRQADAKRIAVARPEQ